MKHTIEPVAYIINEYNDKFGIPRQSCLINDSVSEIVFYEKYRDDNALRGLEGYSHIWLLWIFSNAESKKDWSPTVRPPRLGGNKRMGVFSTRSPFHPNRIGLSCVKLLSVEKTTDKGTILRVAGADLQNGTPIIDIKPYLSFTDSHPEAACGFADDVFGIELNVNFEADISAIPDKTICIIKEMLKQDPRPSYQNDPKKIYSMIFSEYEIKFKVKEDTLTIIKIEKLGGSDK